MRKFVRCRSQPLSLCTFARCTLPPGRPLVAHTLGFLSLVGVNAGSNEVYYARCSKTRHLLSSKTAVMQAWTVSAPGTLTFSPACNSHTARHDRVCTTNEHPGGSVQLSNERKLYSEAGSDINKFAMEVLFRVHAAAGVHLGLLPSGFPSGKFELRIFQVHTYQICIRCCIRRLTSVMPHQQDAPTARGFPPVRMSWMTLLFKPMAAMAMTIRNFDSSLIG